MMDRKPTKSILTILFTTLMSIGYSLAYGDNGNQFNISDMGTTTNNLNHKQAWNKVGNTLKRQLITEYRSESYDEVRFFSKYVELIPAEAILGFLEAEEKICHRQAHELGGAVFRKHKDINKSLKICGNGCTNACMHGAIGEAFSDTPLTTKNNSNSSDINPKQLNHMTSLSELIKKMEPFCRKGEMARLHKRGNCAHAMGHALMLKTNHDIENSLNGCSHFSEPGMDYYCATGVYMQYINDAHLNKTRKLDVEQWGSNYPCNQHTAYPAACYRYIVSMVKNERDLGLEHLVILCSQLPGDAKGGCYHGLGAAYTPYLGSHPTLLKVVCSAGNNVDQALCIEGAIEKLADFNEQWALAACETLDGKNKSICLDAANEKMYRLDKTTIEFYRTGIEVDDTATIEISDAEICIDGRK